MDTHRQVRQAWTRKSWRAQHEALAAFFKRHPTLECGRNEYDGRAQQGLQGWWFDISESDSEVNMVGPYATRRALGLAIIDARK